ncbi:Ni/Fe hydrogenase subunit alpha [Xanthobacteraceae bacterium Astr-EGSB]|uniref:Ni/Fe hydrogenase subunit alpha n=1 Tax=Astrobacterium formosum TaxID=3069710 RepID=UPI0027B32AB4|nr:Ni/Fe hydrogenase subunit alpha [Xanthobacteraceae bacterium Astr-EGSB]
MKRITIDPVSRIEGHAKITIDLDADGRVASSQLHITQVRGFEKFVEGRPFYEMPGITARICGICPVSHLLASAKACDQIIAVNIPPAAKLLRMLLHYAQTVQSHALSFFYLSSPDILLGMDSDPAKRNVIGVIEKHPELARLGIELRKFGLTIIEGLAQERVHPSWVVPGGVATPMAAQLRDKTLAELPTAIAGTERTIRLFKSTFESLKEEIDHFGTKPTMYAGLVDDDGNLDLYDGRLRFVDAVGDVVEAGIAADRYAACIAEATLPHSYLKAPYYRPAGPVEGVYRVGPLGRINAIDQYGTPMADAEMIEFHERFGRPAHSSFLYHYARLIELLHALERIGNLLNEPMILDTHVRATAGVNAPEGVGMIEAPRGVLIHHYKVDEHGAMTWANLIVATGHNNFAIGNGITEVAEHFVDGNHLSEGMLNRLSALVRAYDPCFSCSTHASGQIEMKVELRDVRGEVVDEIESR